jgi:hypothetical protein
MMSVASGSPMMRPPMMQRRRQLLGRSQEVICEGGGDDGRHLRVSADRARKAWLRRD